MLAWPSIAWITFRSAPAAILGQGGGAVPQVMQPDRGHASAADKADNPAGDLFRRRRPSVRPGEDVPVRAAGRAAAPVVLAGHHPADAVAGAWHEVADEHLADLRRIDAKLAGARKKLTTAVTASGTSLTDVFGVGPVIAATIIGDVADPSRFPTPAKFASYNGTAPIEVSSGSRKIYRLSMRGNRRLNHVIHMAAVIQIAHKHSKGHACYQRKLTEGKTPAEARRALKRKISDTIYTRLLADARARAAGPGGQPGNDTQSSAASSHPERRLLRTSHSQARHHPTPARRYDVDSSHKRSRSPKVRYMGNAKPVQ